MLQYIKDHSSELQVIVPIVLLVLTGICTVVWYLVKRFFLGEEGKSKHSGISSGHDTHIEHSVVATGAAKIEAEVIGGDKTVLYQQNFIFSPTLRLAFSPTLRPTERTVTSSPAEPKDKVGREKVEKIMLRAPTLANKKEMKKIFRSTPDKALKIQIALFLGPSLDPLEDTATELIEIMNETIPLAQQEGASAQLAALLAYKGTYHSLLFTYEYQEYNVKLVSPRGDHPGMMEFYKREMDFKDSYSQECLQKSEEIAKESGSHDAIAAVYLSMGQVAAHRAAAFAAGDIPRRLEEKEKMRKAFALAEKVYVDSANKLPNGGELEIANVKHNFANCLRMLGKDETEEAKNIEEDVVAIAKKYGDRALVKKAEFLMQRLEGKPIPDYYNGEEGEDLV
ncbi:MAG: hypothetical protein WC840_00390 [Candidatus Peribacteraceae bacterium]